jgi:hypothetical protein
MEYDILKGVGDIDSIKTSSNQLSSSNPYLEYLIEGNEALNGFEGEAVKNLVMNYQQIRDECMSFRTVYRLLGKQSLLADNTKLLDPLQIPQIGRDLEERNRQLTIAGLRKQGAAYKDFNARILTLLDNGRDSPPTADEGTFTGKMRRIETGVHFEQKYNLDEAISQRFAHIAKEVIKQKYEEKMVAGGSKKKR